MTDPPLSTETSLGPRYWRLFAASTVSNLGDGVFAVALPLITVGLTRDPTTVAGVAVAQRLPWLLFALPAGALVDRGDRRRIMVAADVARGGVVAALAAAVAADVHTVAWLYVTGFVLGVAETLFDNASQTILPRLVGPDQLPRANGNLFATETITNSFVGPPLGGLLVAAAASLPLWLDGGSYLVAAALVASLPGRYGVRPDPGDPDRGGTRPHLGREIAEGVRWLWGHRLLRSLALLLGLMNLWLTAGFAVLVLFATERLGLDEVGFGLLLTATAIGSVLGGIVAGRLAARLGAPALLVVGALGTAAGQLALAPLEQPLVAGLVLAVGGFAGVVWNVVTVSLRQRLIPDHLLGRVNSVYRFLGWGGMPVGALVGGLLADAFGLAAPFVVGGLVLLAAAAVALPGIVGEARRRVEA